jgi:hypothetical protein
MLIEVVSCAINPKAVLVWIEQRKQCVGHVIVGKGSGISS